MAVVKIHLILNVRAAVWVEFLARKQNMSSYAYITDVLLKHLENKPGVDLSQSPYSEPKGVSDGKKD